MLNINKVMVAGHVGSVEIRYTGGGDAVLNLSIATNRRWIDKHGNKSEAVEWHRVVVFGQLAKLVKDWVKKGTQVYAEGVLRTRKWQDKGGNDRWTTEIVLSGYSAVLQVIDKKEQEVKEPPKVEDADNNSAAEQVPDDADILQ
ncbi:Single-stranded DNA-binding protein [uncultured Gammaproteobacteria bacterium]|jgi:single-strand DNA-binding protein|nr:Single-stranded DNA-binding protein [uncultured Gammaproteobacteria bacterium]CAC9502268.1 Single-stranded DNA-binding protein [uncultured Gammaproteobacteria bacterium]CAC9521955.1 Single-stranded DNA-binding protein [uncultured Gammaproteobacteria bacterium]